MLVFLLGFESAAKSVLANGSTIILISTKDTRMYVLRMNTMHPIKRCVANIKLYLLGNLNFLSKKRSF